MNVAKTQNKPADLEKSLKLCPKCGKLVTELSRHRRIHEFQSWGYKCPLCNHFETHFNKSYMVQHLKLKYMSDMSCKFEVPQGYSQLLTCGLCNFSCLNEEILGSHMSIHITGNQSKFVLPVLAINLKFQIKTVELSKNFENLLEKTAEMLQKNKIQK